MCHVLIIEDDAIAATDIQSTISMAGATSFSFADTERAALRCARESLPAVIISDVMLATGSGPEAVNAILAEHGPIPAIYITAVPEECPANAVDHVLEKPFSTSALVSLFRTLAPV